MAVAMGRAVGLWPLWVTLAIQVQILSCSPAWVSRSSSDDYYPYYSTEYDLNSPKMIDVYARNDVTLKCPLGRNSRGQYIWYKQQPNGKDKLRITQFRDRYEVKSLGHFTIRSVTVEDAGTYVCKQSTSDAEFKIVLRVTDSEAVKTNSLKTGRSKGDMEPYSAPEINRDLLPREKVYKAYKGRSTLLLKCESSGNPKPTVTWRKNGEIIHSSKTDVAPLAFQNLTPADNAVFKCEAENLFGKSSYEITLSVTDLVLGTVEILRLNPKNVTVTEGESVKISCVARFEFQTKPAFFWVKKVDSNKTDVEKSFFHKETSAHYQVLEHEAIANLGNGQYSSDFIIRNASRSDTGEYYCVVAGLQGFNQSEARIFVEADPLQLTLSQHKVAAQWAILWTSCFVALVLLVVTCFVKMYGCQSRHKGKSISAATSGGIPSMTSPSKLPAGSRTELPESSPLTMTTNCATTATTTTTGGQDASDLLPPADGVCCGGSSSGMSCDCDHRSLICRQQQWLEEEQQQQPCWQWSVPSLHSPIYASASYRPNSLSSDYLQQQQQQHGQRPPCCYQSSAAATDCDSWSACSSSISASSFCQDYRRGHVDRWKTPRRPAGGGGRRCRR